MKLSHSILNYWEQFNVVDPALQYMLLKSRPAIKSAAHLPINTELRITIPL